jgi:acetylornithine deacetylase
MKFGCTAISVLLASVGWASAQEDQLTLTAHDRETSESAPKYRKELVELHELLVSIPSISGNENEVGAFLVDYLTERGFHAELEFVPHQDKGSSSSSSSSSWGPEASERETRPRFNVLAWHSKTRSPKPRVLLTSHIDTVPPFIPYSIAPPRSLLASTINSETVISGRGSVDAKASVAAQIVALIDLLEANKIEEDDVILLFVVGEETTGDGMRYFSETLGNLDPSPNFEAAIFGEPTEGKLACGHKGFLSCRAIAHGKAGHSGYPWLGLSAIEILMRALVKVLDTDLGSSERFGNTTVNVGTINGGVAANVIAEHAEAHLGIRCAIGPKETGGTVVEQRLKEAVASVDGNVEVQCRSNRYGAIDCDCDVEGMIAPPICSRSRFS